MPNLAVDVALVGERRAAYSSLRATVLGVSLANGVHLIKIRY